jgi:serine/threonine-protein kinase
VTAGPDDLAEGDKLDRYVIEEQLGSGGMGVVYRARHASIGQNVCIKVLRRSVAADPRVAQRFLREAQLAARAGSPHIVQVHDFATTDDGRPFFVMEHLEGKDLEATLNEETKLPTDRALSIAHQILEAVGVAHDKGILHRDLKPANVFLTPAPDGSDFVKILDFGIGKVMGDASAEQLTRTGMLMGTPFYMAPEQFAGAKDVGERGDLYSVAVILYEMLSGKLPHDGDTLTELLTRITSEVPVPLSVLEPDVPPGIASVIERGLSKDPDGRYASAKEMADALRRGEAELPSKAGTPATRPMTATDPQKPQAAVVPRTAEHEVDPMVGPAVSLAPDAPAATTSGKGASALIGSVSVLSLLLVYCLPVGAVLAVAAIIAVAIFFAM